MALLPNGQTCLENIGLVHRPVLLQKNDYRNEDGYIYGDGIKYPFHPNALSDGDGRGRGMGLGGHTHSVPDCSKVKYSGEVVWSPINYSDDGKGWLVVNTNIGDIEDNCEGGAGDCVDVRMRSTLTRINNYSKCTVEYSSSFVNTRPHPEGEFIVSFVRERDLC